MRMSSSSPGNPPGGVVKQTDRLVVVLEFLGQRLISRLRKTLLLEWKLATVEIEGHPLWLEWELFDLGYGCPDRGILAESICFWLQGVLVPLGHPTRY